MNYFKKLLPYGRPYKKYIALNIFFNILYAIFSALSFIAVMPLIKIIFETEDKKVLKKPVYQGIQHLNNFFNDLLSYHVNELVQQDKMHALFYVIILIITVFLLKNVFGYLALYFIAFLRNGVLKDLRNDLYHQITKLPISYFSEKRKGDIMARIGNDVLEIQYSFLSILELFFRDPIMIIVSVVLMFAFSVRLTIFIFIFIPIAGFIINTIGKNLRKTSSKVQKEQGFFLSILDETLGGLKVIKGFNAEPTFNEKFNKSTQKFEQLQNKLVHKTQLASPISEVLGITVFTVLLWYGGQLVFIEKSIDGGVFLGFLGLAYNILTPAKQISRASYTIKKGNAAAERVLQVLETENNLKDDKDAIEKKEFNTNITLKNIWFKYEDEYVLKDFSLTIPKGTSVALVGQSGSGKSTIANLMTRFYDVSKGEILIDGMSIKKISKKSLRALEGLVTQDAVLFNDSIKNNILLGMDKTDEEIIDALKIANAWEFVKELPLGIETNIGDSGNKLSGGQKQRLSIARAVLKNSPIMILDEATSALDSESEKLVQQALENMMKNRTSIVIAHRLSTIQNADMIIVMKKGEIVEQGTHQELLEKQGEYHKLVALQTIS